MKSFFHIRFTTDNGVLRLTNNNFIKSIPEGIKPESTTISHALKRLFSHA